MERAVASRVVSSPAPEAPKEETTQKYEMTPDADFDLANSTGAKDLPFHKEAQDNTQKLVDYIQEKMEYFNNKLTFTNAGANPPTPYEIEIALSTWLQTSFSINSMYEFAQTDADNAEAEYRQYFQISKHDVRNTFNKPGMKTTEKLPADGIEAATYSIHRNDIAKLEAKMIELKREASFLKSMQKSWSDYLWVLRTLQAMSNAEIQGSRYTPDLRRGDETDLM